MSLGDYLRLLRARRNGLTPWDIETALPALTKGLYRQMEQRYRPMGDDDAIRLLADFFDVPFEDLRWRLDWPRKGLSRALVACQSDSQPITLNLWNGATVHGYVRWWDLGAIGLARAEAGGDDAGLLIIQRHAVERWDPRIEEPEDEEEDEDEEGEE